MKPICLTCGVKDAVLPGTAPRFCSQPCAASMGIERTAQWGWCPLHSHWSEGECRQRGRPGTPPSVCQKCGREFVPARSWAKYCSKRCSMSGRMAAYRAKRANLDPATGRVIVTPSETDEGATK